MPYEVIEPPDPDKQFEEFTKLSFEDQTAVAESILFATMRANGIPAGTALHAMCAIIGKLIGGMNKEHDRLEADYEYVLEAVKAYAEDTFNSPEATANREGKLEVKH